MLEGVAGRIKTMIDSLGRDVDVQGVTSTGTQRRPTNTESEVSAKAAFSDYKDKETDGTIIQSNDRRAHLSWDTAITKQDKIIDGDIEYQIINLRQVQPGSEKFLYIAQLRSSSSG